MPKSAQVPGGVVSSLQGRASVVALGENTPRALQAGDTIQPGDVILAEQDTQLQITDAQGNAWLPRDMQLALADTQVKGTNHSGSARHKTLAKPPVGDDKDVDAAIGAVERGDADAAAAAGLDGGGSGALGLGLRVDRVIETVSPQSFTYDANVRDVGAPFASRVEADAVNRAPLISDPGNGNFQPQGSRYQLVTDEDQPVSGQVKATDPDGDPLTFAKGSDPAHGQVTVNPDGTWTYTPDKDYNGRDSFTVTVSDGKGGTAIATVDIGITPVNDVPQVNDPDNPNYDPATGHYRLLTEEDQPVSGQIKATDADGDTLTFSKGTDPAHGSVVINPDGTWTYTPAQDYNGSDTFTVTVSDGQGGTATATVEIGILPSNDPPRIDDPSNPNLDPATGHYKLTTDEDKPVSGQVKATDPDGDALTFAKGSNPAHGSVVVNADGTWTYTPAKDYNGSDSFTVTVSDGHGGTTTATVDIGVLPVNDAPKIDDPGNPNLDPSTGHYKLTTDEDKPVSGQVKATDPDGDTLTFAKGTNPAHGSVVVNADGTWTYTPTKNYNGSDSFTVTVSDGHGGTTTATIDIGITPINDPPKVTDPGNPQYDPITGHYKLTTDEDKPVSGQVKATDVDGDTLTFAKGSNPAHGSVVVNADGTWTYTPAKDYNGSDSFTVTVSDGHGGTATATVDIGVLPVNDAPKIDDPGNPNLDPSTGHYKLTTDEDKPVSGLVKATDPDGDTLTFAKGTNPAHGSVVVNADGTWTYTPSKNYNGSDSFTVTVSDGHGGTTTATIDIGITPVNDAPKIDEDPNNPNYNPSTGHYKLTTDEDKPVSGQVKATDPDGDTLTFAKGTNPAHGSVVVNADGTWTYTPSKNYNGSDSFTVTVSDGHGGTTTATVDIGITPINDPPKVTDPGNPQYDPITGHYKLTTDEDKPVSGQVKATDVDGDTLTFAKGSNPAHGSVVVNADGTWTYTPAKDYNGSDSFTVTVSDGHGGTATATIDIGVLPVNDAPKIDDPSNANYDPSTGHYKLTTDEDKPVSGLVKATDPDGDTLTFAKGSEPAHGSVVVNADGTWTYTPSKNYNGSDSFTVTVSDGKGGTTTATIDIGITPVNDAPKIDEDPNNPNYNPSTGHYKLTTDEDKPVSGQVKATDPDGDTLTFAKGTNPAHGSVVVHADGTWTYTPAKDYNGGDAFTVTVSDGKGGTTTATVDIGITPANDAPTVTQTAPATVSEEGLAGGNADNQGTSDTSDTREATGQLTIADTDGDAVTLTLSGPAGLTSGGVAITWTGTGTASDPLVGSAGSRPILSATVDNQGHYKVTLQGPIDHANTSAEDVRSIDLQVKANDGHTSTTSSLTVRVEDDSPLSGAQTMQVNTSAGTQNTNLMLIIDTSGSMKDTLADKTVNGIKAAIKSLVDRYDDLGEVKIQIVTFNDGAQGRASWMTVAQAKTFVDALSANGGTNYDAALATAKASFVAPGKLADGVNVSYFITDGQPSKGKGIDSGSEETTWEKFLHDNAIDSYAIGTGTLTAQYVANIEPVAYNGITGTEQAATTLKTNQELSKYLLDTVPTIKSGSLASLAGADGLQKVESFSSSNQLSSSLDAQTQILTITLKSGGEIKVNMLTGDFSLHQGQGSASETFSYTVIDKDGDRGTGTITLNQANQPAVNHAPVVCAFDSGHNILGLVDLSVNPLLDLSKNQHVAVNDVDNNLVRVDIRVDQLFSLGMLLGDHSKLSVSLDAALTQGLHITGNDSRHLVIEADVPGQTIDIAQVNHVLATLSYDPAHVLGVAADLFPKLTIKATDAAGASDTQTVSSSIIAVDVDLPTPHEHHESGHGEHHGSCDTDVFSWTLADRAPSGEHHTDKIFDFDGAARAAGGDVLDLRDLLHVDSGANAGSNNVDKLLNFLDFDTQSQPGSTVIHVSANGSFQADAGGHSDSAGCADQQHIVLANVDIRSSLGLDAQANDHQIIAELVQRGKLLVDNC